MRPASLFFLLPNTSLLIFVSGANQDFLTSPHLPLLMLRERAVGPRACDLNVFTVI